MGFLVFLLGGIWRGVYTFLGWILGARLNYAENLLRFEDDRVALYGVVEGRPDVATYTFKVWGKFAMELQWGQLCNVDSEIRNYHAD